MTIFRSKMEVKFKIFSSSVRIPQKATIGSAC